MSVREMVARYRKEILSGGLAPTRAGEIAAELSALLGNISDEILDAEMAYHQVYAQMFTEEGKANRAEIRAQLTPEYRRKREAEAVSKVVEQMIISLRKLQDTHRAEMQLTR